MVKDRKKNGVFKTWLQIRSGKSFLESLISRLAVNLLANESYVHSGYIHVILYVTFLVFTFLSTVISVVSYSLTL